MRGLMNLSQVHYLPLSPTFFFILVGLFVALLVLIQLGVLRYAYMRLGISSGAALLLLLASLIGSYFNIPVAYLPEQRVLAQQEIDFFGMRYVVPFVAQWPGTLIAVNVGGAVRRWKSRRALTVLTPPRLDPPGDLCHNGARGDDDGVHCDALGAI